MPSAQRTSSFTTLEQISDINLTPLMDLTFILLITFIITFPLIEQGIPVQLPKHEAQELAPSVSATITIDDEGTIFLDDVPVGLDSLTLQVTGLKRQTPDVSVLVRADKRVRYGRVVDVLKILHAASIEKMALVTESVSGGAS